MKYMSINLYEPPEFAVWGTFNDRVVSRGWVDKLQGLYENFIDSTAEESTIEVVLDPKWLTNEKEMVEKPEMLEIGDIPEMKFDPQYMEEIKKKEVWMMGGNHRRIALKEFLDEKTRQLEKLRNEWDELRRGQQREVEGPQEREARAASMKEKSEEIAALEMRISKSTHWCVKVYSRGTLDSGEL